MNIKYTKEELTLHIEKSKTWGEVCRSIGIKEATGAQSHIKKRAEFFEISFSHFLGQSHLIGTISSNRIDAKEHCHKGSKISSHNLRNKLIRDGYKKAECENCHISEWLGEPVGLELDHIDSDKTNNEFINLKILCPNCHALKTRKTLPLLRNR